jgi:23S rRNA pseudouridine2605 synthase
MTQEGKEQNKGERIAKRMAAAGLCSRRDAERWITEGRVKVNGAVLKTPAILVQDSDKIMVDGKLLKPPADIRLFKFHKPVGLVTTTADEKGRATVFSGLPADLPRLVAVGRLDLNSEGLLLLTTSGELARFLELPARGYERRYRVRAFGYIQPDKLEKLQRGITVEGVRYGPIDAHIIKKNGANTWMMVTLTEGKNREIRKVLAHLGLQVNRLIREDYGPFTLGDLPKGALVEVPPGSLKRALPDFYQEGK